MAVYSSPIDAPTAADIGSNVSSSVMDNLPSSIDPMAAYDEVINEDGTSEYYLRLPSETNNKLADIPFDANLAEYLDEETLEELAEDVKEGVECDISSREGYEESLMDALRLLKSMPDSDDTASLPFDGACDVVHPMLIEACTKLQSRASNELLPANGPVKTKIVYGEDEEGLKPQALRVQRHMNWQLTKEIPEYYRNSERAFFVAAAFGDAFKKKSWDNLRSRISDSVITPDRLIVNNRADCIEKADRITEVVYMNDFDFAMAQKNGTFIPLTEIETIKTSDGEERDIEVESDIEACEIILSDFEKEVNSLIGIYTDRFMGHKLYEQRVYLDLDLDPGPKPYVVTYHCEKERVISVVRDWSPADPLHRRLCAYSHYALVPSPGFYSWGYIHLLGSTSKTLTALMRIIINSGEKASNPLLAKNSELKINGGSSVARLGNDDILDIEVPMTATGAGKVSDALTVIDFKDPSPVLMQAAQWIDGRSQQFADSIENVMENASNYGPVGTTMALLDNAAKFFSAVHKRFHKAQAEELEAIAYLNYEYLSDDPTAIPYNRPGMEKFGISRSDYDPYKVDVMPVSDPNVSSQAHRLAINNAKLDRALQMPGIHNMEALFRDYYNDLGVEDPSRYMMTGEQPQQLSPVEDIIAASQGKPIKAFPDQDHKAHIAVKRAFLEDPQLGGNDLMQQAVGAVQANIREHMVLQFQLDMQAIQSATQLGEKDAAAEYLQFAKFRASGGAESPEVMVAKAALLTAEARQREADVKQAAERREVATALGTLEIKKEDQAIKKLDVISKYALAAEKHDYTQTKDKTDLAASMLIKAVDNSMAAEQTRAQMHMAKDNNANKNRKSSDI